MSNQVLFTRVGYTYLPTTKMNESISWYTQNLGLKLISKFEDRGSLVAVLHYPHVNAIAVLLIETRDYRPLEIIRNGLSYPVMAMNCKDIEYTHKVLKEKGIDVDDIINLGNGDAKYFYFKDNEGNLLEAAWSVWDPVDKIKDDYWD